MAHVSLSNSSSYVPNSLEHVHHAYTHSCVTHPPPVPRQGQRWRSFRKVRNEKSAPAGRHVFLMLTTALQGGVIIISVLQRRKLRFTHSHRIETRAPTFSSVSFSCHWHPWGKYLSREKTSSVGQLPSQQIGNKTQGLPPSRGRMRANHEEGCGDTRRWGNPEAAQSQNWNQSRPRTSEPQWLEIRIQGRKEKKNKKRISRQV